jgi:putative oxidoreductase
MKVVQFFLGCIGRILISLIFILASIGHIIDWQGSLQYLTNGLQTWMTYGVNKPEIQKMVDPLLSSIPLLLSAAIVLMLIGGIMVFFGMKTRFGAFLLIIFVVPTTLLMHPFWILQAPDRDLQMIMFMKNLSILGGLLYLLAYGNGGDRAAKKTSKKSAED